MDNTIKVTVEYKKPATSKFDALMAEYEAAKKMADETVAYYKPLADAAEEAKFDAIMEQLETIKGYLKRISDINGKEIWVSAGVPKTSARFRVEYSPYKGYSIIWWGETFSKYYMRTCHNKYCEGVSNIIGNWNEWKIYEQLEKGVFEKLNRVIIEQKERANHEINRFNNIVK